MERNESFYKSIVNNLHSAFAYYKIITDSKGKPIDYEFIEVNQSFEEMTRLKSKDIIGKSASTIFHDKINEKDKWIEYYGEVALKGIKKEYEHYSAILNRWYQVNVYSPEHGFFITIFNEISIYKHIEGKIEESENKYRRLVDFANEGIMTLNENNAVTFANKQMCTMLGYTWEEMRSKKEDYFMFIDDMPDYIKKADERKHGKSQIYERRLKHKDGSAIWALISATPIFSKNNTYKGSFKLFTDITDRIRMEKQIKKSELKFRSYFEKSPYAIFIFNSEGRYIEVNRAACVLYEYTHEEFKELNILNILVPECIEPGLKYFNKLINSGNACIIELSTVSKKGKKYVALLDSVKISDDEYICYSRNIKEKTNKKTK